MISDPAEWKPLPGWSRPGEDRRPQLRQERQAGRVLAFRLALRAWLGQAGCGRGSPTKWARRLSSVRTPLEPLRESVLFPQPPGARGSAPRRQIDLSRVPRRALETAQEPVGRYQ